MKRILFFIESLHCGGAEKSLVNLLCNLDRTKYSYILMVLKKGGEFEKFIPKDIEIQSIDFKISVAIRVKFKVSRIFNFKKKYHNAQLFWKATRCDIPRIKEEYDIAIAWGQGFATYFVSDKVIAKNKIAWVNTDFDRAGYNQKNDIPIYQKFDKVVGVSEHVVNSMQQIGKHIDFVCIEDITDSSEVIEKASENVGDLFKEKTNVLLSVGRLAGYKGFDLAIESAKILLDRNIEFCWYVIGEGAERVYLEQKIKENNLTNNFKLLGYRENPYPYIKVCDIYVQTSRFEGMGLTVVEASILNKPIVTTNFPTAHSIITHDVTGLIVDMNPTSIAESVEKLLNDNVLREKLVTNLKSKNRNNTLEVINKVETLFGGFS